MFSDFTFDVNEIKLCQISLKKNKLYSPQGYLQKSNSGQLFKKKKANIGENILGILSAVQ